MKHLKTFFAFMLMAVLSIGQVWGASPATITFADLGLTNQQQYTDPFAIDDNVSITFAGGTNDGKYYTTGTGIRTYGGGTITIAASSGTISQAVFSWDGSNKPSANNASVGTYSTTNNTWTGSASSFTLTRPSGSGHWRLQSVTVTYSTGGNTKTLTASPNVIDFGTVEQGTSVSSKDIEITFANLTGSVTYSGLSSPFTATGDISKTGDKITISANTATVGEYEQTLTVTSTADSKSAEVTVTMNVVEPFDGLQLTFPDDESGGNNITSYTATWSAVIGTQTWSIFGFNTNKWDWNPAVIKTGRKNNSGTAQPLTATIETQVAGHAVGDIVVTVDAVTAAQVTSHKLYVADNSDYTDAIEINGDPSTIAVGNITYTVPTANRANGLYYKLEYATAGTGSSNGTLTISKITYAYANAAPQKQSTGLAYEDADKNNLVKVGASFTAPTLTNPNTLGGITYASSDDAIVEVNASTGAIVEIKAAGKAVITASRAEDETYKAGSAFYTIYVAAEAGTAADPLSEASAKALIDLGCTMNAHVHGTVLGSQDATKFTVTLAGGMQFYKLKDIGNVAFESAYIGNGDEVTAVGSLLKYNSTYELAEGCYLTAYTEYTEPLVDISNTKATAYTVAEALTLATNPTSDLSKAVYIKGVVYDVKSFNSTNGTLDIYIKDDGVDNKFEFFKCAGIYDGSLTAFTAADDVHVGDDVIGYGVMKYYSGGSIWEFDNTATGDYLVSLNRPEKPSISADPAEVANVAAEGVTNQTIALTYENIENYLVEVTLHDDAEGTEAFSGTWLTASVSDADNYATITYSVAANEGAARTTYMKVYAIGDDDKEATKIIAVSQEEYVAPAEPAELPFSFTGGSADIANTQGMSQEGLGSDYTSGNPTANLKFDGTGDYVLIHIASDPGQLTYDIKGNSFSASSTFKVQESADGIDYSDVVTYTGGNLGEQKSETKILTKDTRYVKFIYTEKAASNGGNVGLGNIAIAAPVAVEAPTFSPAEGTYVGAQSVTLACSTNGATIYYTKGENPADPTSASTEYKGAIPVSSTITIKAIAIKGSDASSVAAATYTIVNLEHAGTAEDPYTVADARTAIDAGVGVTNVYATGIVSEIVTAYNSQYGNISYNISADGLTTSDQLQAFRGKDKNGADFTSENDVQVGDVVVIYGSLKKHEETYEFDQNNQRYSFTRSGAPVLQSIAISGNPTTTTYDVGSVFDVTGLVVTGTYDKGDPAAITTGITWEVRTNSTSESVALASYKLAKDQTALQVHATVGDISSAWFDVTGLSVKEHEITPGAYDIVPNNTFFSTEANGSITGETANLTYTGTQNDITITYAKGTQSNMYINATQTRVYNGSVMGFSVPAGYVIKAIAFTADGNNWAGTHTASEGSMTDNKNWSGTVNSVTITFGGTCRITSIKVTFAEDVPVAVATPAISPDASVTYTEAQSVTITCETDGATIYYTTNGNTPDNTSTQYTGAFTVDESKTIKAIAYNGEVYSDVATAVYTINIPEPEDESVSKTWDLTVASYDANPTVEQVTWSATYVSMVANKAEASTAANNYLGGDANNRTSSRFYKNSTLTITPNAKEITSVVFTATSEGYATVLGNSSWTNASASASGTTIMVTPTDGKIAISAVIGNTCGFTSVQVNYKNITTPDEPEQPVLNWENARTGLNAGYYYTMCLDKAVTHVRGASIWKVLSKGANDGIILEEVEGTLDAGRPYFFYATAESMDVVYTGNAVGAPVNDADNNGLVGSFERTEITKNQSNYILHNNALYFVNSEAYVGAYRAYLNMSAVPDYVPAQGNSPRRRVTMSVHAQDVATGVDAISDSKQPMKVMIDNNLYIIRAGQMYDMTGNKVK